jgi:hypothetical protein
MLDFKVFKKCSYDKKLYFSINAIWLKNAFFDVEFESVEKVARRLVRKKLPAKK